jgi:Protein of unknown function (DUF4031)
MTVYVYKLPHQAPLGGPYPPPWYGLTADSEPELHALAEMIGQDRQFYRAADPEGQQQLPLVGHYDLDEGQRDQAVAAGAQPISWRQRKRMLSHH